MSKYSDNMPPNLKDAIGWMFEYIEPGKVFLDMGCSTGYFGSLIKEAKKNKVYGLEISDDRKQAEAALEGVYSFDLDGEWSKEIYERKYDYVFYGDVIEHLKDPEAVLRKTAKLLKPNGLIFISTPNIAHISIRLELMGGNFDYEPMGILDNTHLKYFTKKSLIELVERAGYHIKAYTFSANDYPDTAIEELLAKCGLKATEEFWKLANSPEARAFQHKVVLESERKVATKSTKAEPHIPDAASEKPETIRNAVMVDLETQVKNLRTHAEKQAKIIEHYVRTTKDLETKNQLLESGKKHIIGRTVKRVKHSKHKD